MSKLAVIPVKCDGCNAVQKPGETGWRRYWVWSPHGETHAIHFVDPVLIQADQRDACGERCMIVDIHRLLGFAGNPCADQQEEQRELERQAS